MAGSLDKTKKKKRPAPLSIRLSACEREELERRAAGRPLSRYVRAVLFAGGARRLRRASPAGDQILLSRILAQLGSMNWPEVPDEESGALIAAACEDIRDMRVVLLRALGRRISS